MTTDSKKDLSYFSFLRKCLRISFDGGPLFYVWMTALLAITLVGVNAYAVQMANGMVMTHMTDHVSWGLYIANFTFCVGLAAGGVMMVIPAYLYDDHEMHDVVIVGEIVAIASILMCLAFVTVDLGRPDRMWHMLPFVGKLNWPISMLSWDVLVLTGYLLINLHIVGYIVYMRYLGKRPNPKWYVPFVMVSIVWAISIHTVTAFLYSGLGGRPFWNTAILAPRFIMSAFVSGPAFIIVVLFALRRFTTFKIPNAPMITLTAILRITVLGNLFMFASEAFTQFYTGGHHAHSATYLFFGLHGQNALVPWIWTALTLNLCAAIILLFFVHGKSAQRRLIIACFMVFFGVWIEKGMGLIVPGFVPSTLSELVEYEPSLIEWQLTAGIWAFGIGALTIALKITATMCARGDSLPPPHPRASTVKS